MRIAARFIAMAWLAAAAAWAPAAGAAAWSFVPTPLEWNSWPDYCRAQYTLFGETLPYEGYENAKLRVASWRGTIGENTFIHLHHYCAALHYRTRSLGETNPRERAFLLSQAWDDGIYAYTRSDPVSTLYPAISVGVARIRMDMGKDEEAVQMLENSIKVQPRALDPYVMLAVLYRRQRKLDDALAIMQAADRIVEGQSAEVQYTLGLINIDRGDLEAAAENARQAYDKGHPLPGLRESLRAKGHWPPKPKAPPTGSVTTADQGAPGQATGGNPPAH